MVELRDENTRRRYHYFAFSAANKRDLAEFSHMLKKSDWPNLLWRENKNGIVNEHYLLPVTSPATFKTWIFLQQYYKSIKVKQKIDKFSIQNYVSKFAYDEIDFNNWSGPQCDRKNLDGSLVCSRYRAKYYRNGKYQEPENVPLCRPTSLCKMRDNVMCTCFIYPCELLDNMRFRLEITRQGEKLVRKPAKAGKLCFYCSTRYYGDKCKHPDHTKNLTTFIRRYTTKYRVDAVVNRSPCVECRIIIRVVADGKMRPVRSNELLVNNDFFQSPHWKYVQEAYSGGTIYIVNYPLQALELLNTVDKDTNVRLEFFNEDQDEIMDEKLKMAICPNEKCDKLMQLFFNDKIASIINSTYQPQQFPEGYIMTMVPKLDTMKEVEETLMSYSHKLSVYDPSLQESVINDHRKREENKRLKQAKMLFGSAIKRNHKDDSEEIRDYETNGAKKLKVEQGLVVEDDGFDDALNDIMNS